MKSKHFLMIIMMTGFVCMLTGFKIIVGFRGLLYENPEAQPNLLVDNIDHSRIVKLIAQLREHAHSQAQRGNYANQKQDYIIIATYIRLLKALEKPVAVKTTTISTPEKA